MTQITFQKNAINASECIDRGWNLIKSNYWIFFAMIVVQIIIVIAVSAIPVAGDFLNPLIAGPLTCGIYFALLRQYRRESVEFPMMFEGFTRFLPAALVVLIESVPWIALAVLERFIGSISLGAGDIEAMGSPISAAKGFIFSAGLTYLAVYLLSLALHLLLFFALPLIADHNLSFGDALKLIASSVMSNLGGLIVLLILEILISIAGLFAFCIGILFVLPVISAANIIAYRQVFPETKPDFPNMPPSPDSYGSTYGRAQ